MPKKSKLFISSENDLFAPCRRRDFNDGPLMRKRLSKIATSDIAYKSVARLLFFLISRRDDRISVETIATCIFGNENRFSSKLMDPKTIKRFALRETKKPNLNNYFDYFRFLAILIGQNPGLSDDYFIREILSEFDVVSWYEAARDMPEADFDKFVDIQMRSSTTDRRKFYADMLKELRINPDTQGETRMQVMGRSTNVEKEVFYSFRYTSRSSQISCSRVEVDVPDVLFPIMTYTTTNERRVRGGPQSHNSSGFVFGFDGSIVFFGRVSAGAGLECLMIKKPPIEIDGRLHGIVVTPDLVTDRPPCASRIVLIRERKIAEDFRGAIKVGLMPAKQLPRALLGESAEEVLGNHVNITLNEELRLVGKRVAEFSGLVAAMDKRLAANSSESDWPFTSAQSRQAINPIRSLKYDSALTAFRPDDAQEDDA